MTFVEPRIRVQREPRRQLHKKPAWFSFDDGMTKRPCFVLDVSPGGARIATDDAMDVGDSFELALVPDHPKRELCEVVWRRAKTYGVKFIRVPPPTPGEPAAGLPEASEPAIGEKN
jgi:hypothetical protein